MHGLFHRMNEQIGDGKQEGVTTLEIMELPRAQQQILLFLMRNHQAALDGLTFEELQLKFADLPNLPDVIDTLSKHGWLIALGDDPTRHYKINLKRKRGSSLPIWANVLDRLSNEPSDKPNLLADKLSDESPTTNPGIFRL